MVHDALPISSTIEDLLFHLNFRHVRNLQYHIYACYFTYLLYGDLCTGSEKGIKFVSPSPKVYRGIFVGIPQHQKVYLLYVPSTKKIISSYDAVFDEIFSSALAYTSQPYSEAMSVCTSITYTHCVTSSKEQTGDIIMFAHFEEGKLLSETREDLGNGDKSDGNSIMPPLLIEEEMYAMYYGNESDDHS